MRGTTITCPKCAQEMPVEFSYCGRCGARIGTIEPVDGEMKQVTVLFADISGFTSLAERLDPEELHENMRTAWDAIAAEIREQGGLIEKYIGDAVVAVFGAVEEQLDHPERAQRAALAVLGALDRENQRIAERTGRYLALRVGVNTGLAMAGAIGDKESEFGVLGDAVNVAARLEQAAEPGEVLVGDATYRLTPGLFAYEPHPPVAAKGKSAPLVAWRLLREETALATDRARGPLVGRDGEVALLVGALEEALAGKGGIVSIVGEAGLGKTRLVDEVLADPRALGARVARARCSPYDAHRAYGAMSDLLRRALAISPTAPTEIAHRMLSETLPGMEPEAAKLVLAALGYGLSLPALSGNTRRKLLDRAIRDLILRVARTQPVILALTDVQWADTASQELLAALAPALADSAALVLTTYRPELTPPWTTSRGHVQIRLTPLEPSASATLLQTLLPASALPQEAIGDIVARSAGNPTYLEESARWLLATGVVVEREGASPLADVSRMRELPDGLPMLLLRRAEQANPVEKRLLQATAVAARACDPAVLRALFGRELDIDASLGGLVARGLLELTTHGDYRFRQSLLRELIYDSIPPDRREDLHARIGQVIETVMPEVAGQQPELLAHHFADSRQVARAIDHAMRAGERASSLHALTDALHHFRAAADLAQRLPTGGADARARALVRACDAARALGHEDALAIAEEALAATPSDDALRAALRRRAGELAARSRQTQRSAEHLAEADRLTPPEGRERAELTLAKAFLARSDERPGEALTVGRAAVKEALAAGDRGLALEAEEAVATFAADAGSPEEALRAAERCVEHASAIGDLTGLARALATLTYAALDRGDLPTAEELANQLLGAESRLGNVSGEAGALRALGRVFFALGRFAQAEVTLERALALADPLSQVPQAADPASTLLVLGSLAIERGDFAAAATTLAEARALSEHSPARAHLAARVAAELARLALFQGALEEARQHTAAAYEAATEHECRRCGAGIAATLVEVAAATGDLVVADARRTEGLEHSFRLGLPVATAEIRAASARLLAARGDVLGARNECTEALAVFERLGPASLAERTKRRISELDVTGRAQTA
jgi:class 3 adenylate cyclase/tetratricopeptide (TPR) repeat protein